MEKKKLILEDFYSQMTNEEFNQYVNEHRENNMPMYESEEIGDEHIDATHEEIMEALGGMSLEEFDLRMKQAAEEYFNGK